MTNVVCIVGSPDSGKTTLVEALLKELGARGYKAGALKHTYHEVDIDTPGKDTARFSEAGSRVTALATGSGLAVSRPGAEDVPLGEILELYFTGMDILLAEGYKKSDAPKIEVCAEGASPNPEIEGKIAIVATGPVDTDLPVFKPSDAEAIVDALEKKYLTKGSRSEVRIWVDGSYLNIKPFVKAFVGQTVKGMLSSLRGGKNPEKIHIKIGR